MTSFAARRLTEAHRLAQVRLGAQTVQQMRTIWPLLDPASLDRTFTGWLRAAVPVVGRQRSTSARLAANYLTTFRAIELGADVAPIVAALSEVVDTEQLATSLLVTGPLSIKRAMSRSIPIARALDVAESSSSASAMRLALNGGRETLVNTINRDPEARGWTRVTSAKACDFCSMLAGRGGVYTEASGDFQAHDGCNCSVEAAY